MLFYRNLKYKNGDLNTNNFTIFNKKNQFLTQILN